MATAGDYCEFPLRVAVSSVRDVSCVPCSCPEPVRRKAICTHQQQGWPMAQLPVSDSAKPPNPVFVLPRGVSAHNSPDPRKCSHRDAREQQMWRWDMSSSSGEELHQTTGEENAVGVSPPLSIPGRVCFHFRKSIFSLNSLRCFSECLAKGKTTHSCQNQPSWEDYWGLSHLLSPL